MALLAHDSTSICIVSTSFLFTLLGYCEAIVTLVPADGLSCELIYRPMSVIASQSLEVGEHLQRMEIFFTYGKPSANINQIFKGKKANHLCYSAAFLHLGTKTGLPAPPYLHSAK